jgi:hypothetical protein
MLVGGVAALMPAIVLSATDMTAPISWLEHLGSGNVSRRGYGQRILLRRKAAASAAMPGSTPAGAVVAGASARPMCPLELRGHAVFVAHSCGTYHGMDGVGGSWAVPALADTGKSFPAPLLVTMLQQPSVRMKRGAMPIVSGSPAELASLAALVSFLSSNEAPAPSHQGCPQLIQSTRVASATSEKRL